FSNNSPPQTPHGSWRSSAPVRHHSSTGQSWHSAFARSTSAGRWENHSSESYSRHGKVRPPALRGGMTSGADCRPTPVIARPPPLHGGRGDHRNEGGRARGYGTSLGSSPTGFVESRLSP